MSDLALWMELTRLEQRLVIKLFGGGSFRRESLATIEGLQSRGLADDNGITFKGIFVFKAAIRVQNIRLAA